MKTRILIADDHRILRVSLKGVLEKEADFEVVALAEDGSVAIKKAIELKPDVILMDIDMPIVSGIEATTRILDAYPARIIGLSMHVDSLPILDFVKTGAAGYLDKNCSDDELVQAIRAVGKQQNYFTPKVTSLIINRLKEHDPEKSLSSLGELTDRERGILQLLAEGKTSKEIADLLNISPKTVEAARGKIKVKLGVDSLAGLIKYAIREGLTTV